MGKTGNLQGNDQALEDWAETLRMVGVAFPLLRQFPWMIKLALEIPLWIFQMIVPTLSRFLELHKVGSILLESHRVCTDKKLDHED